MAKISLFVDDFGFADTAKWTFVGTAGVSAGQLQLIPASSYGNRADSATSWDLTSSVVAVELVSAPLGTGTIGSFMSLYDIAGVDSVQMYVEGGVLYMVEDVAGSGSSTNVTYSATSHRWIRIRHDGTNVLWETAPDGLTWTTRRTKVAGRSWASVTVQLQAGYYGTEPTPGTTIFDNFNVTPGSLQWPTRGTAYPASSRGAAVLLGSRADPPAASPIEAPIVSAGRNTPLSGSASATAPRTDTDPGQNQPAPAVLIGHGRPWPTPGSACTSVPRAEPSPAQNQPIPTPVVTTSRPPPVTGSALTTAPHAHEPGAPIDVAAGPPSSPSPSGSAWTGGSRTDPPVANPDPPRPESAIAAGRPAAQASGNAWLPQVRADPPVIVDAPPTALIQAARPPTTQTGAAQLLTPRADPSPNTPPAPQPSTTTARPPATPGTASIVAPRAGPAATPDPMPSLLVTAPGRPRALPGAALMLRQAVDAPGGYPAATVFAGARQAPAGAALLLRSTFTPPPPVLYLRPPIQSPGIRLAVAGSAVLQRLTEQTGHVCPPPTPRPNTGTTANSTSDVTPRPYSGVTPAC